MKIDKRKLEMQRAKKCLQVKELATVAGVATTTIQNGYKREIAPECVGKIARALGVDVEEIIVKEE